MPLFDAAALARTYDHPSYDAVADYREVLAYHDEHPDEGSYKAGKALDLPRNNVQKWLEGSRPGAAHAVDVARALRFGRDGPFRQQLPFRGTSAGLIAHPSQRRSNRC